MVSVNTGNTYYVVTSEGLAAEISNGDLRSIAGNNGVFGDPGQFPTGSYQSCNYFRDVAFSPRPTYTVSGTIAPAAGGAGAAVTLSGAANQTVTADAAGGYVFANLPDGSYTVTPSKAGYSFTPTSAPVTISGADASGVNFTATAAPTYTISGAVAPAAGGSGATVSLSGAASRSVIADANGLYQLQRPGPGQLHRHPHQGGLQLHPDERPGQPDHGRRHRRQLHRHGDRGHHPAPGDRLCHPGHRRHPAGARDQLHRQRRHRGDRLPAGRIGRHPGPAAAGWSAGPPASYTVASTGSKALYAWAKDAAGNVSTSRSASVTITLPAVGQTLFTTQTPAIVNERDGTTVNYELGMSFQSAVPGQITAIRFWKASSESGTHTGRIWSSTGTQLASVAFTAETASGWQQQALPAPVTIAANTTYVVSVNTGNTYYVATELGLATQIVNQNLRSVVGTNGRYGSPGQFPTRSYQSSNYFRDVVFSPGTTYTISGAVAPAAGGAGATVTLSGAASRSVIADANGLYSFSGLAPGSYTVTPTKAGYSFTPTSAPVSLTTADVTGVNFTASGLTYTISGAVAPAAGGSGATVTLSGAASRSVIADANGLYSFSGLAPGSYTVTPTKAGYSFTPASAPVSLTTADVTGVNFTASGLTYTISGAVAPAAGGAGATVTLSGAASRSVIADANGLYSFSGLAPGSYTVTPTKAGYSFTPASAPVSLTTADVTGVNFTASGLTYTISGAVAPAAGGAGATVTLSGAASRSVIADANGLYSFSGLAPGSYTVTPTKAGYSFTPASAPVSLTTADVTGVNFTASGLTYTISGAVAPAAGGAGATVTLSGAASRSVIADANGLYSFSGLAPGSYTVTPTKAGYSFTPASAPVSLTTADVTGVNFTASGLTYTISGTIAPAAGGAGATVTLSGAASRSVIADANGLFSFSGLAPGSYTVTPTKTGYSFTPASAPVSLTTADVTGLTFTASSLTYTISGTIAPAAGGAGATVTLSGAASRSVIADANGLFSFSGLAPGSYTVTPTKTGYSFTPASAPVSLTTADVTGLNFTASGLTYTISGTIAPAAGGAGATVTLSGAASRSVIADANGLYSFSGLAPGSYTVTPTKTGYSFTPASAPVSLTTADVTGLNFTASSLTYTISGTIAPAAGGAGATVTLSGAASRSVIADANGLYSFSGLAPGSYTVTPTKTGYSFTPASAPVSLTTADVTGLNFTASSLTYTISGTIAPAAGGAGATVTLSGAASRSVIADANGLYSFSGLAPGSYTVTPTKTGYSFTPASAPVSLTTADVTGLNFTASGLTYTISGTIAPAAGGAGATVTLSGAASRSVIADANGLYSFSGLAPGSYTVTPTKTGYSFTPASAPVSLTTADVTGLNFTASSLTYTISGTIAPAAGGAGATVTLSGAASRSVIADANGFYSFSGLAPGSYTVTPTKTGYSFTPASAPVSLTTADVTGLNFTASSLTYTISGTVAPAAGGAGATVTLSGAASRSVIADANGLYSFSGLAPGSYTVTPTKTGYSFTPASAPVSLTTADVTGLNFTATALPPAAGQTLFTTQTPAIVNERDGVTVNYELGMAFQSTVAGQITAIRFWKASNESGTHTGRIWSSTGTQLASVTFTGETASGWQQQALTGPAGHRRQHHLRGQREHRQHLLRGHRTGSGHPDRQPEPALGGGHQRSLRQSRPVPHQ